MLGISIDENAHYNYIKMTIDTLNEKMIKIVRSTIIQGEATTV